MKTIQEAFEEFREGIKIEKKVLIREAKSNVAKQIIEDIYIDLDIMINQLFIFLVICIAGREKQRGVDEREGEG